MPDLQRDSSWHAEFSLVDRRLWSFDMTRHIFPLLLLPFLWPFEGKGGVEDMVGVSEEWAVSRVREGVGSSRGECQVIITLTE